MIGYERPTAFPQWATNDITDTTSLQNNVVEPSNTEKAYGWAFRQFPVRQFFNWLGRMNFNWFRYLDDNTTQYREARLMLSSSIDGLCVTTITNGTYKPSVVCTDGFALAQTFKGLSHHRPAYNLQTNENCVKVLQYTHDGVDEFWPIGMENNHFFSGQSAYVETGHRLIAGAVVTNGSWVHLFIVERDLGAGESQHIFIFDDNAEGRNIEADTLYGLQSWRRVASLYFISNTLGFEPMKQFGDVCKYNNPTSLNIQTAIPSLGVDTFNTIALNGIPKDITVLADIALGRATYCTNSPDVIAIRSILQASSSVDYLTDQTWQIGQNGDFKDTHIEQVLSGIVGEVQIASSGQDITNGKLIVRGYIDKRGKDWTTGRSQVLAPSQYWKA